LGGPLVGLVDAGLSHSPMQPIFRWRSSRRLAVLAYHGIDRPERFEAHVRYLRRTCRPVTLAEVLDAIDGRGVLPKRAVLITFDDGDRTVLDVALPLLQGMGMPAAAFVVAGLLDTDEPFWWEEVEQLVRAGAMVPGWERIGPAEAVRALKRVGDDRRVRAVEELRSQRPGIGASRGHLRREDLPVLESGGIAVGNHSLSHPCLGRCSDGRIRQEVEGAHRVISSALGRLPRAFAYPDGQWDARAGAVLRGLDYRAAFLFDHRPSRVPVPDPLRISRLRVNAGTSMDRFRTILSGLHPTIHRLRGGR
jgi:peptidoglycan/xylan/chitin deacetylase (PgdA/CDA1 family)